MKLIEYVDAEMMALDLANVLVAELETALLTRDRASLVVPGGTTPGPVFDSLSAANLEWDRIDVIPSDERWLPDVHVRSNARLIRERLLVGRAAAARFHPLYAKAPTPDDVLAEIESGIVPCLPISVLLLGMGADMHTASLFPGSDNLAAALAPDAPILLPMNADGAQETRISLSARVLNEALTKHIVITGQKKRNALDKAATLAPDVAPVAAILENSTVHWAP